MALVNKFEYEDASIKAYYIDEIAVLKFKSNAFDSISDLEISGHNFFLIDQANDNPQIKCILFLNEYKTFCETAYAKFISSILNTNLSSDEYKRLPNYEKRFLRSREIKMLDRVIMKMMKSRKIVITALKGDIVTPFIGASLAADFRYVSKNMTMTFSHVKYGLHPSGALAYFLPRYIGRQKAIEYMLTGDSISAKEAMELQIVNKIFPEENFEELAIKEAKKICNVNPNMVKMTRNLINHDLEELKNYFALEAKYIDI